jgi:dTDP-4-amino-4,6-dideoxygalactose transaminase
MEAGLVPVLVENLETYNLNPDLISGKITFKTKAILAVQPVWTIGRNGLILLLQRKMTLVIGCPQSQVLILKKSKSGTVKREMRRLIFIREEFRCFR